LKKLPVGI
jgi:hypothetical protein